MLIGIDSSTCSLSLRNRSTLCSTTKCHQNKSDLKNVFVQKFFFSISSVISIPIMLIGINGGYFPAICRVCFYYYNSKIYCIGAIFFTKKVKLECNFFRLSASVVSRLISDDLKRQLVLKCLLIFESRLHLWFVLSFEVKNICFHC